MKHDFAEALGVHGACGSRIEADSKAVQKQVVHYSCLVTVLTGRIDAVHHLVIEHGRGHAWKPVFRVITDFPHFSTRV